MRDEARSGVALPREIRRAGGRKVALGAERLVDVIGALAGLVLLSPVPGTALASLRVDGRPVFLRQPRSGLRGAPFTFVKFRTMQRLRDVRPGVTGWAVVNGRHALRVGIERTDVWAAGRGRRAGRSPWTTCEGAGSWHL